MESKRVALVVGIGNYENFQKLDCCPQSAIDVYHLLVNKRFGCCDPNRSILLIGENQSIITAEKLQASLNDIDSKFSIDDQLIFFFCGHGNVDENREITLLMSNSFENKKNNRITGGYHFGRIFTEHLGKSINRAIIIIDACHSQAMIHAMKHYQDKNINLVWSCSEEKKSEQSKKIGKTYFSHYFCKGIKELKGEYIEIDSLVKYINKHAGMNQQADCCANSGAWIAKGDNAVFVNRKKELANVIYDNDLIRCQIIDAPEGYGKTAILQKLKNDFEEKGTSCFLINIKREIEGEDRCEYLLSNFLFHICGEKARNIENDICIIKIVNKLQKILKSRAKYINHDVVVSILIDIEYNSSSETERYIIKNFIPKIIEKTEYKKEILFIIAGRYLSKCIYSSNIKIKTRTTSLPAFSYENVIDTITRKFDEEYNISKFSIQDAAAHLFFFSGGHPGAIAYFIETIGFDTVQFPDIYFKKNGTGKDILEKYISIRAKDILNSFDEEFRSIIEKSSIHRYYDEIAIGIFFDVASNIIRRRKIFLLLKESYLFIDDENTGLLYNEIIRRVISIFLRNKNLKKFISFCRDAQKTCLEQIKISQRSEWWFSEYLFQIFQEFSSACNNIGNVYRIDFFKRNIFKNRLHLALTLYVDRKNKYYEINHNEMLIKRIEKDDELRFIINYSLRKVGELYNDGPFEEIKRDICNFLHKNNN